MLFVSISFAMGTQHEPGFWWNMGFKFLLEILTSCMIGNRISTTLTFGHVPLLQGHHGQMILPTIVMFDRFELSNKLNMDSQMFVFSTFPFYNKCILHFHGFTQSRRIYQHIYLIHLFSRIYNTSHFAVDGVTEWNFMKFVKMHCIL